MSAQRSMQIRPVAALVLSLVALTAFAGDTVNVPRQTAPTGMAPPETRACTVNFDGLTEIGDTCPQTCYGEWWDGPVLVATNRCERTLWIAYEYTAADGKRYRSACFELAPGVTYAIDDVWIVGQGQRQVDIMQKPGPGYARAGFIVACSDMRTPIVLSTGK